MLILLKRVSRKGDSEVELCAETYRGVLRALSLQRRSGGAIPAVRTWSQSLLTGVAGPPPGRGRCAETWPPADKYSPWGGAGGEPLSVDAPGGWKVRLLLKGGARVHTPGSATQPSRWGEGAARQSPPLPPEGAASGCGAWEEAAEGTDRVGGKGVLWFPGAAVPALLEPGGPM